ncbi:hypothetical protein KI123_002661, partial [Enterococcus faecalis]|nr:hypothetical protein [Enterococcus faecalis]
MDLTRIYRGMENGAESIEENFNKIGAAVDDFSKMYQKIAQKTPLWTGVLGLYANQSATPSKKITDCQTGWILVFQAYESGSASESTFHYFHIPKSHAIYHNGAGINLQISDWRGVNRGLKYV